MRFCERKLTFVLSRLFIFSSQIAAVGSSGSCVMATPSPSEPISVQTTCGPIKGRQCTGIYDDVFYSFEKVPYAQPPLGALRFKAPVPVQPWTQLLDCTETPKKALQQNTVTGEIEGSEDCLYLNIYAKKLQSAEPLPVLVYIHGGGFERGDATRRQHAPDYFMARDVLLVSVAYRLGVLGFLSLADPSLQVPGNAGLRDLLLALKWLQQNLELFNGDPNNVTLMGESAGASAAHFLMLAPQAKGLFHKVILLSGIALCPWALQPSRNLPQRLASIHGLPSDKPESEILRFLEALPPEELVRPNLLTKAENMNDCIFSFGPVVEPYVGKDCMVPRKPAELLATSWSNDIPVIVSGTSFEGLFMYGLVKAKPFLLTELGAEPKNMLPWDIQAKYDVEQLNALAARIRANHFGERELVIENILDYCDYISYKLFWHPIFLVLKSRLNHAQHAATYLCRFDFDSPDFNHHRIKFCGPNQRGVAHADDLSYLFYSMFSWKLDQTCAEYTTITRMIGICTSFAASGDPNCPELLTAGKEAEWLPLTSGNDMKCLNISLEPAFIDLPEMEKLRVWDSLYEE